MTRSEAGGIKLEPTDRVALIAGSGQLPVDVAEGLAKAGKPPFVMIVGGEGVDPLAFQPYDHMILPLEAIGDLVGLLRRNRITHVIMAGGVSSRPNLRRIKWSLALLRVLPRLVYKLTKGDNTLLSAFVAHLEQSGFEVVGAHEVLPDLLARPGVMGKVQPRTSDQRDIDAALEAALAIGRLDIGQAAVAVGGRAVALEGVEGTDGLLERMKELRNNGRIAGIARGVLVKCAKPDQELRADLPTIGPATIEGAHAAGLAGVAVEADRAFVLEFARTIERADALGLFVIGLDKAARR
ncbi:LpxI family protein [Mesorhizobium sp. ZC-5]|uniref:LpxI family protein n=1 Tax=Mesorhizobium sp. ZC-5 TaxID=2986066 RepID=UPI0021E823CB|nr:UDP-2,3-diacylglucosamine diphosphatase LpxI [Mesorhizobium sp. ZC-5]MCV3241258.1 UDP-2,3-diacylglucosamine diphosphatase LpxI [Mesorhizobium sp. ZC-5]